MIHNNENRVMRSEIAHPVLTRNTARELKSWHKRGIKDRILHNIALQNKAEAISVTGWADYNAQQAEKKRRMDIIRAAAERIKKL